MLRFNPLYLPKIWGGHLFREHFGREIPLSMQHQTIGESWELGELPEYHSSLAQDQASAVHAQKSLGDLWRAGALGGSARGPFPFLLKWIDAAKNLSVQVHPDAQACAILGSGAPKTEAWYMAKTAPHALLYMGHFAGLDANSMRQAALGNTLPKWLYDTTPHVGDIFLIPAGTIHAIGAGCLILEVQQPSDTTFRLYDWGYVDTDGNLRPLHLDEAALSVAYQRSGPVKASSRQVAVSSFAMTAIASGSVLPTAGLRVIVATQTSLQLHMYQSADMSTEKSGMHVLHTGGVAVLEPHDLHVQVVGAGAVLVGESAP